MSPSWTPTPGPCVIHLRMSDGRQVPTPTPEPVLPAVDFNPDNMPAPQTPPTSPPSMLRSPPPLIRTRQPHAVRAQWRMGDASASLPRAFRSLSCSWTSAESTREASCASEVAKLVAEATADARVARACIKRLSRGRRSNQGHETFVSTVLAAIERLASERVDYVARHVRTPDNADQNTQ